MSTTPSLLITGATVFDGESFIGVKEVLVRDGLIAGIYDPESADAAATREQVDDVVEADGATLTPGFIDCHVHVLANGAGRTDAAYEPFSLPMYRAVENMRATLHAGVTTARDAGGADEGIKVAQQLGIIEGPRLRTAVSIMSQTGGHGDGHAISGAHLPLMPEHPGRPSGVADGVEGVRLKTRELLRAGADHIKICTTGGVLSPRDDPRHSQYSREEIDVIVAEAAAQGAHVMSHAQGTQGIRNAVESGVRSIEHAIYLDEDTIQLIIDHGAYVVPTLQAPLEVVRGIEAGASIPQSVVDKAYGVLEQHKKSIGEAYKAGVTIAMGTDAGVGRHGKNLEELELLAEVGVSTVDVLRSGTSVAAELLEDESIGRIEEGRRADLVLFDGNLEEVGVTGIQDRIRAVYQDGIRRR